MTAHDLGQLWADFRAAPLGSAERRHLRRAVARELDRRRLRDSKVLGQSNDLAVADVAGSPERAGGVAVGGETPPPLEHIYRRPPRPGDRAYCGHPWTPEEASDVWRGADMALCEVCRSWLTGAAA